MQNENTVSEKLTRIDAAITRMRVKTDTTGGVIENVASTINNLPIPTGSISITENADNINVSNYATAVVSVSGGSPDIYKVETISDMESLSGVHQDDMCVVIRGAETGIQADVPFQVVKFPQTVTFESPMEQFDVYSGDFMAYGESSMVDINYYGSSSMVRVRYSSSDGLTFTKQSSEPATEEIDFGEEITISSDMFSDYLSAFMRVGGIEFEGIYTYLDNSWEHTDIGIDTLPQDIMDKKYMFTNAGKIQGTAGSSSQSLDLSIKQIKQINGCLLDSTLSNSVTLNNIYNTSLESPEIYDDILLYTKPNPEYALSIPDLDCSNMTSIASGYDSMGLVASTIKNGKRLNVVSCGVLKDIGKSFTSQTAENQFRNTFLVGFLCSLDNQSLINIVEGLYNVTGKSYNAGFQIDAVIYDRLNNLGLISKIQNKGWKFYRGAYQATGRLLEWLPSGYNTISDVTSKLSSVSTSVRDPLNGLRLSSDILTKTATVSTSREIAYAGTTKYYPGFTFTGQSSPSIYENSCLEEIGTITLSTSITTNLYGAFQGNPRLKRIPTINNKNKITGLSNTCAGCKSITDISQLINLPSITDGVYGAFVNCTSLTTVGDISYSNATTFASAFTGCTSLESISSISVPLGTNFNSLFAHCRKLKDIGTCNFGKSISSSASIVFMSIIHDCPSLTPQSIYNIFTGAKSGQVNSINLSDTGLTLTQWSSLTQAQKTDILAVGFTDDLTPAEEA